MSFKPGFWRKCRIAFRCARFTVWAAVALALAALTWFNVVGLPGFLKTRLLGALHQRGVELEFTRMRLRFVHGLICDNVRIGAARETDGPVLTARELQMRVDFAALLHGRFQIDGLVLRQGKFSLPLSADESLALTNLQSELRFKAGDTWSLDQFRADLAGATFNLAGEIAHAPEFRHWKMFAAAKTADHGSVQASLKKFSDTLKQIHFEGKPQLNARLNGDASDVHSFTLTANARAPGVETPWFSVQDLQFTARLSTPADAPANPDPAWGFWTNLQPFRLAWTASGTNLKSSPLDADALDCGGVWRAPELAVTRLSARLGGGGLAAGGDLDVATRQVNFAVNANFDLHAVAGLLTDPARARLADITWTQPPRILAGGTMVLPAWTNRLSGWRADLEPGMRLHGELAFTNAMVANAGRVDSIQTYFGCTNMTWSVSGLKLTQERTTLELSGEASEATGNFRCEVGGKLDSGSVRPFLTSSNAARGFGHLYFREPVALALEVTGNMRDFATVSATGRVVATNFAIRGQWVDSLVATLAYSNLTAEFYNPQLVRADGRERFAAEKLTLDVAGQKLFLRHGAGHVSPVAVGEAIGPKTARGMEPYQFLDVPNVTVDGCIPLKQADDEPVIDDANLWVHVMDSVPFRWRQFQTPGITGTIHWLGKNLILTNVVSECYGGTARGWGVFNLQTPGDGTDCSFFMEGTNVDFNAMGLALWSPGNQLRGELSGRVAVTRANSSDWQTWNGYGQMQLDNGLLWNAPMLGLMSPVLNTLAPGLDMGNSRATDGTGRFTMTNGVIFTDSLEIRSLTMRLDYVGTVDLQENVTARVKAQLLRNTPVFGPLFSRVLWPVSEATECEVTGTLENPRITPLYIPFSSVLTAPLHPLRTFEKLWSPTDTNDPAKP